MKMVNGQMVGILGIVDMSVERELLKRIRSEMMLPADIEEEIDSIMEKPEPDPVVLVDVWRDSFHFNPCFNLTWLEFPDGWEPGEHKLYKMEKE
jgi:hypothetical protein